MDLELWPVCWSYSFISRYTDYNTTEKQSNNILHLGDNHTPIFGREGRLSTLLD